MRQRTIPYYPAPPGSGRVDPRAETLVIWSRILGFGGVGLFVVGSLVGPLAGPHLPALGVAGLVVLVVGLVAAVVGAVLGQVGRAMQGRIV